VVVKSVTKKIIFDPFKANFVGHLHGKITTSVNPNVMIFSRQPLSFTGKFGYCPFRNSTKDCGSINIGVTTEVLTTHIRVKGHSRVVKRVIRSGEVTVYDRQEKFLFRTYNLLRLNLKKSTLTGVFEGVVRKTFVERDKKTGVTHLVTKRWREKMSFAFLAR
jgi:hypothetical protein